jgi:hypothetical protein
MDLSDLHKDLQRFLLAHWKEEEINTLMADPDYFFDQVVLPHIEYLRRQGNDDVPRLRKQRTPAGEFRVWFLR